MTRVWSRHTASTGYGSQAVKTLWVPALILAAVLFAGAPAVVLAGGHRPAPPRSARIALGVSVGWNDRFRGEPAWVPVRISVTNLADTVLRAMAEVPDSAPADRFGMLRPLSSRYQVPLDVPAGVTKRATIYLPGADISGEVVVRLRAAGKVLATHTSFPAAFVENHLVVGMLTADQSGMSWLQHIHIPGVHVDPVQLTADTLDPRPEALATFDLIVFSGVDSSQLTDSQRRALEWYVRSGGSLLLVGGPFGEETVRSLPSALVPVLPISSVTLRTPSHICTLQGSCARMPPASVNRLSPVHGALVLARSALPLAVGAPLGAGWTEMFAFDPATAELPGETGQAVLNTLFREAVPGALRVHTFPSGFPLTSFRSPAGGLLNLDRALSLSPTRRREPLFPAMPLVCAYVALLALLLTDRKRRRARWAMVPLLAALLWGVTVTVPGTANQAPIALKTFGMVEMAGAGPEYPASLYMGVSTSTGAPYHIHWSVSALGQTMGQSGLEMQTPGQTAGWRITEGTGTSLDLLRNGSGATQVVALRGAVPIPGDLHVSLVIDARGRLVGTLRNGTGSVIRRPALLAGDTVRRFPDLRPGATVRISVRPHESFIGRTGLEALQRAYTESPASGALSAEIWTALQALPEVALVRALGPVTLVGWTTHLPGAMTVNGSMPEHRTLVLLTKRVDVGVRSPAVGLPAGITPAALVDVTPRAPAYTCCGPDVESVYIDRGGTGTVLLRVPRGLSTRPRSLAVRAAPGSSGPVSPEQYPVPPGMVALYDWGSGRWMPLRFHSHVAGVSAAHRWISSSGAVLLRLRTTPDSGQIFLADPQRTLQIVTTGTLHE